MSKEADEDEQKESERIKNNEKITNCLEKYLVQDGSVESDDVCVEK